MTTQFSVSQAKISKHWYEKIPYTFLGNVPIGRPTSIFSVSDISHATNSTKMSFLSQLAATQKPGVQLQLGHDTGIQSLDTGGFPANLQPLYAEENEGMRSVKRVSLAIQNNTGATVDNFQTNYTVAMKNLTTADKVLRGIALTSQDVQLQSKFQIRDQGIRPLAIETSLARSFWGHVLDEVLLTYSLPTQTFEITVDNVNATGGEYLILNSIAASAPIGNQVVLNISRDDDTNYGQVLADNMTLESPLHVWVPAVRSLTITMSAQVQMNSVPIRISYLRVKPSQLIEAMFGHVHESELSGEALTLYQQAMAGVLV